jgi:L-asparagine transporter-like permease
MVILTGGNDIYGKIAASIFGICMTTSVYLMIRNQKSKKHFSQISILKNRLVRKIYGSFAVSFGLLIIGSVMSLIVLDPEKAIKFLFSPLWFTIFFVLALLSYPFVAKKMD